MNKVKHQIGEYSKEEYEKLIEHKLEQAKAGQRHVILVKEKICDKLYNNWLHINFEKDVK